MIRSIFTWRKTISGKLTIIYAAVFIIVLLLLNTAALLGIRFYVITNAKTNLNNTMDLVLNNIDEGFDFYGTDIMEKIIKSGQNMYFRILSPDKRIIVQSNLLDGVELPIKNEYAELKVEGSILLYRSSLIIKNGFFIGYLQTVRDMTLEYRFLKQLFFILLITSIVGSIGAIFIGYTLTRRTLNPIKLLTNTAQNISIFDLGQRLKVEGPEDELTNLAHTFNSMLDRLESAFKRQQQFVSDASHELRTPISVIQGYINLLDRWGKDRVEVRDEAIRAIKNEVKSMHSLVESLLFLARGDNDRIVLNKVEFWVDELINELIQETKMISQGINIYSQEKAEISFFGDRKLIKQMLRIFIDNSLKFTPPNGEIRINAQNEADHLIFTVIDTGIGIPKEELPHVFKRFYRVDKARSGRRGTGLGLAIAKSIIDRHQGKVKVVSEIGKGTEVKVSLPKNTT